ncbi:unnamed protein product [Ceutorhynchus assimilis]|uniref:DUF4780 domain-containing protein n=1 Tax=Ceutorhynchus assimilis TaxID=467358 RepID=A0A9N9ME37_9CUCU|nr:unnamed protein product [Ceutorhynchus assimilis]
MMSNDHKNRNKDIGEKETMEVENPTLAPEAGETPSTIPPTSDQEQELLRSDDGDSREAISTETKRKRLRLSKAQRRNLSRLIKSGISHDADAALKEVIGKQATKIQQPEGDKSNSGAAGKRLRSDTTTSEQASKRARAGAPSYKAVVGATRLGLIPPDYPSAVFTNEQLTSLQQAVLEAVQNMPDGSPQVRFQGCTHRPGWLQITCADDSSLVCLEGATEGLLVANQHRAVKNHRMNRPKNPRRVNPSRVTT